MSEAADGDPSIAAPSEVSGGAGNLAVHVNSEDEANEARMLGLSPPAKRAKKSERAPKKDKAEIMREEIGKAEADLIRIYAEMAKYPDCAKNVGYEYGRVQRFVDKLTKSAKDTNMYDSVASLTTLGKKLTCAREIWRATSAHLPARGNPVKKHREAFYNAVVKANEVDEGIFAHFSMSVRHAFADLTLQNSLQENLLTEVARALSSRNQLSLAGHDEQEADRKSTNMAEKILMYVFEEMYLEHVTSGASHENACQTVGEKFLSIANEVLAAGPVSLVETAFLSLEQLVSMDPDGAATLDGVLDVVLGNKEKPVYRVALNSKAGEEFITAARSKNAALQNQASIVASMNNLRDDIVRSETDFASFLSKPAEENVEQIWSALPKLSAWCMKSVDLMQHDYILQHASGKEVWDSVGFRNTPNFLGARRT